MLVEVCVTGMRIISDGGGSKEKMEEKEGLLQKPRTFQYSKL